MKPNGKITQWALPVAAVTTLCIGMGADVFHAPGQTSARTDKKVVASPAQVLARHSNINNNVQVHDLGGMQESTGVDKTGVDAGKRVKQQPTPISSFPGIQTVNFDVTGIESRDGMGNAVNEVFNLNIGAGSILVGIGWDVTIEAFAPSWLSEMVLRITDEPITGGINLSVGIGDDAPGVGSYDSGGVLNVADLGLDFAVGANGTLRLEFFEGFDDAPGAADGIWQSGTLTFQYIPAGAPCPADLTGDSAVDTSDLLQLLSAWGSCPGCPEDLTGDDAVDTSDLLQLLSAWGNCPPGGPDPVGACCMDDFTCMEKMDADDCANAGGTYGGDFTTCLVCPAAPDGETCETAFPLVIDGASATISTVGLGIPAVPLCDGVTPSAPTAWFMVNGTDQFLTAHACTVSDDARVAVYCGNCDQALEPLVCLAGGNSNNDMSVCGNPFDGQATWCAGVDNVYYIAVWRNTTAGDIEVAVTSSGSCTSTVVCSTLSDPVCAFDSTSVNCQGGPTGGTWASSDIRIEDIQDPPAGGVFRADDFNASTSGNITSVCWQGVDLALADGAVSGVCPDNSGQGQDFRITYYHDVDNRPDGIMAGPFVVTPDYARIGSVAFAFGDAGHIDYTANHPPVAVTAGTCYWIEIVGLSPEGGCAFFWKPSPEGNGRLFSKTGDAPEYPANPTAGLTNADRHFCINIALGDPDVCVPGVGACCVDGSCSVQTSAACAAAEGCFFPGAECEDVTCLTWTYNYECTDAPVGGVGAGSGTIVWALAYDVEAGEETISEIQVSLGSGAPLGSTFNWAIYDTQSVPNATNAVRTGTGTWSAEGIRVDIPITPYEVTSGRFWIAAWVQYTSGFPAGYNASQAAPAGTTYASLTAPADANSLAGLTELTTLAPTLTGVWQMRAD